MAALLRTLASLGWTILAVSSAWSDDFRLSYKLDGIGSIGGGIKKKSTAIDLTTFGGDFDLGHDLQWSGLTASFSVNRSNGGATAQVIGELQNLSSLQAGDNAARLFEAWIEKAFDEDTAVKGGLIDLNSEFDVSEPRSLFLNASQGIGPEFAGSGENGPSIYPITALGVRGRLSLPSSWTFRLAAFDGRPGDPNNPKAFLAPRVSGQDGALLVAEAKRSPREGLTLALGAWGYTGLEPLLPKVSDLTPVRFGRGSFGVYGAVESPAPTPFERGHAQAFVRLGWAVADFNPISSYAGAGYVWSGPLRVRPSDVLGIAIASAGLSAGGRYRVDPSGQSAARETNVEATYSAALLPWLNLQPAVAYVIHPGGRTDKSNATVVALRLIVALHYGIGE